jgi:DNA polymerase-4
MRMVAHFDLDAFFCAVEILEDPTLAGKPIVVGGRPEKRGVVAAASYPARKYGIHSALPMARAIQLCPDLIILPPRFELYRKYSQSVMELLRNASPCLEQVSVDEAYLDFTEVVSSWTQGVALAKTLQERIRQEIGLSTSAGVATNRLVAKVASDFEKPGGFTVVAPGEEAAFLAPLPVRKIPGIGQKTAEKLARLQIYKVRDLARMSDRKLRAHFGKLGLLMSRWAHGIDERPVGTKRVRKSISQEKTFPEDYSQRSQLVTILRGQGQKVAESLQQKEFLAKTVTVKLRYADFETRTRRRSLTRPTSDPNEIVQVAITLFDDMWDGRPVRLVGVGCGNLSRSVEQMVLPLAERKR